MEFRKNTILSALGGGCLLALAGCSSAPIKMECQELQTRLDYSDMSADQRRFAQQELDDCRGRAKAADDKDSAFIEGTEKRFTPSDSDSVPSASDGAPADPKSPAAPK